MGYSRLFGASAASPTSQLNPGVTEQRRVQAAAARFCCQVAAVHKLLPCNTWRFVKVAEYERFLMNSFEKHKYNEPCLNSRAGCGLMTQDAHKQPSTEGCLARTLTASTATSPRPRNQYLNNAYLRYRIPGEKAEGAYSAERPGV